MRALLLTLLLAGCAGEATTAKEADTQGSNADSMTPVYSAPAEHNGHGGHNGESAIQGLATELSTEGPWQRENGGEAVLTLSNTSAQPMALTVASGMVADFVLSQGKTEVWRYSNEMMFTQALGTLKLAPGEAREVRVQVSARSLTSLQPGQYQLRAYPNFHPRNQAPKVKGIVVTIE